MGAIPPSLWGQQPASPELELGAYEELWTDKTQSFKALDRRLSRTTPPSYIVPPEKAERRRDEVLELLRSRDLSDVQFVVDGMRNFPKDLQVADAPVHFLYCRGNVDLLQHPHRVAVIGSRKAKNDGMSRAFNLVKSLVADNIVVVSGLARGIDTAAHKAAIKYGGKTIGVIGTPISEAYPRKNLDLQNEIARNHLLISQVPVLRYLQQTPRGNRFFFPARNTTMSALSQATVVIEAGETSGTLIQARAALAQKRKLFIFDSCFQRGLKWPEKFLAKGGIRVSEYADIRQHLGISKS